MNMSLLEDDHSLQIDHLLSGLLLILVCLHTAQKNISCTPNVIDFTGVKIVIIRVVACVLKACRCHHTVCIKLLDCKECASPSGVKSRKHKTSLKACAHTQNPSTHHMFALCSRLDVIYNKQLYVVFLFNSDRKGGLYGLYAFSFKTRHLTKIQKYV